jgi:UDP-glucose 4-epimerase
MVRILTTGGAGFIGFHLLKKLLAKRIGKVIVVDNLSNANPLFNNYITASESETTFSFYNEDIRNREAIFNILKNEKIDICIHLAATNSVLDSITNPEYTLDVNINGTFNVLEACSKAKVKNFIFLSSSAVYGRGTELPLSEDQPLVPLSPYGASKAAGEALVSAYVSSKKIHNGISLRLFNVYGEDQNPLYAGAITRFIERLSKGSAPIIYGNGKQTRDFVHVDDVVNAILLATEFDNNRFELPSYAFNIGTGVPLTITDLANKMISMFGLNLRPLYSEAKSGEMQDCYADTTKSYKYLDFLPKDGLESGLLPLIRKTKS